MLKNIRPLCEAGGTVEILKAFSGYDGVYATVVSTFIGKMPNGEFDRLYKLDMPREQADYIHPSFHYELEEGVQEKFLQHVDVASGHETHWQEKGTPPLQATLDSASTIDMINTPRYFIPGTVRKSTVEISTNNRTQSAIIARRRKWSSCYENTNSKCVYRTKISLLQSCSPHNY